MKLHISFLIVILLMLAPQAAVYADAAAIPDGSFNSRYYQHFISSSQHFIVNGADGFTSIKKEPGSSKSLMTIENGTIIFIERTCLYSGEYWGFTNIVEQNRIRAFGWVKMGSLLVIPDHSAFKAKYSGEFYNCFGTFSAAEGVDTMIVWPWPGSGIALQTVDISVNRPMLSYAYMDEEGREWGLIRNFNYITIDTWVCISDPMNPDIPAFNPDPAPKAWEPDTLHVDVGKYSNALSRFTLLLIITIVSALIAATVFLIKKARRK